MGADVVLSFLSNGTQSVAAALVMAIVLVLFMSNYLIQIVLRLAKEQVQDTWKLANSQLEAKDKAHAELVKVTETVLRDMKSLLEKNTAADANLITAMRDLERRIEYGSFNKT